MKNVIAMLILSVTALTLSACKKGEGPPATISVAPKAEPTAAKVIPGSYEDWCAEHQVPESMCTKCNPTLTAAFKATGDWCPEHGLPESQCRLCNPTLSIVRPPQKSGE